MEFIKKPADIRFQQLPEMLDKLKIETIRSRAFVTSTIPDSSFYFILLEPVHQHLILLLSYLPESGPIYYRSFKV